MNVFVESIGSCDIGCKSCFLVHENCSMVLRALFKYLFSREGKATNLSQSSILLSQCDLICVISVISAMLAKYLVIHELKSLQ